MSREDVGKKGKEEMKGFFESGNFSVLVRLHKEECKSLETNSPFE